MQGMACCFRALPFRPGSGELSCHRQHGKNEIEDLLARVVFQAICSIGARPPTAWRFQSGRGDQRRVFFAPATAFSAGQRRRGRR